MTTVPYFLTYHAIERLQERFPEVVKEENSVRNWTRSQDVHVVKDFFDNLVNNSEENRAYLNNSNHIIHLYEKYGYDAEYKFMENFKYGILFVIAKKRNENHFRLVTLMPTEYRKKVSLNNIKYNDKDKKEDKKQKRILDIYSQYKQNTYSFENENLSYIDRLTDLEKHSKFEHNYNTILSDILNKLTQLEQQKNKRESIIVFCSKNYEYTFIKKDQYINIVEIKPLSLLKSKERKDYFDLIEQLHNLLEVSTLKEQFNKHVSLRSVVANHLRYNFKYYEKINAIEIVNEELLLESELLASTQNSAMTEKIKDKISQNYFFALDINNPGIFKTQIDDKVVTYYYEQATKKVEIIKVEYFSTIVTTMSHTQFTDTLLNMCFNNKTEIIELLSSNKKLRKAKIDNKEIIFIHFVKNKQILLVEMNETKPLKKDNYLLEEVDFNSQYIEQYRLLTESLSREDEFFLKKVACESNIIKVVNKRKAIHRIQYQSFYYEYLLNKTKNEGYVLTLLKKEA